VVAGTKAVPSQTVDTVGTKAVPSHTRETDGTIIVSVEVLTDPETFVALSTKLKVPGVVGVPEIAPVEVLRVTPVGRSPEKTE
jgi:hypothetical protein